MSRSTFPLILACAAIPALHVGPSSLDRQFAQTVRPFITTYCAGCHGGKSPAAQFDLTAYTNAETVTRDYPHWALVLERLTAREMPPKALPQPPDDSRQRVIGWIRTVREEELRKNA